MDMEVHSCLPWLNERGMGYRKKLDQIQNERPAVIGARVWLSVSWALTGRAEHAAFQAPTRARAS